VSKEDLDKDLDSYLFKDEKTAKEHLDADMDAYFAQKPDGSAPAAAAAANGTAAAPAAAK